MPLPPDLLQAYDTVTHRGQPMHVQIWTRPNGMSAYGLVGDEHVGEVRVVCKETWLGQNRTCYPISEVLATQRRLGVGTALYEAAARYACGKGFSFGSDTTLSVYSRRFWRKQVQKGRARRIMVRAWGERENKWFAWPRYMLPCPPPASLASPHGWRGWR